jgi:hypothetical protein
MLARDPTVWRVAPICLPTLCHINVAIRRSCLDVLEHQQQYRHIDLQPKLAGKPLEERQPLLLRHIAYPIKVAMSW